MRLLILSLTLTLLNSEFSQSQTRVHPDQMVLPEFRSPEEAWCPGPSLQVQADRLSLLIGRNWSAATPCYIHFNITPPASVDPISVSSQIEPITLTIKAGFTGDDEAYIYALAPTFSPVASSKIAVRTKNLSAVSCGGCSGGVLQDTRTPRTFPPNSVPIGFAVIRGGKFLPKADELLSRQQVYIGPGAEMALRADQGGYWFEVSAATQTAANLALSAARMETARNETLTRMLQAAPPAEAKVKSLDERLTALESYYMELQQRVPPSAREAAMARSSWQEELDSMRASAQMEVERVNGEARDLLGKIHSEMLTDFMREVPKTPETPCYDPREWALDEKYLYRCLDLPNATHTMERQWVRMERDRKWKPDPKKLEALQAAKAAKAAASSKKR